MYDSIKRFYIGCHLLTAFFSSYNDWKQECALQGMTCELSLPEYNDFLRGTNASVRVPLWASACKNSGHILQNEITCDVIKFYKKFGYQAAKLEGNPPDYIGEQLRFLEYLSGLTVRGVDDYSEAIDEFVQAFSIDTAQALVSAVSKYPHSDALSRVFRDLETLLKSGSLENLPQDIDYSNFSSYLWEKKPEIPAAKQQYICSAGLNNCGGKCRINVMAQEGCLLNLDTDSRTGETPPIRSCVRGKGYKRTFLNADRLRYPMKRVGERGSGKFERISWEEATDKIAAEMTRIRQEYGASSRYAIYATGVTSIMRPQNLAKSLLALDGGYLDYYNSYSSACATYVMPYVYGEKQNGHSIEDITNTELLILWGHNPSETILGTYTNYYISQVRDKGVPIIVIDPRQSDSAIGYGSEWIGIRPSTDGALIDAMAYVIWKEGLQDQAFMDTHCIGFDRNHMPAGAPKHENYYDYLFGIKDGVEKTPEWAEQISGVPAETIRRIARRYASTKPACILPGLGLQRTGNGEQTFRGLAMLCALTGNVGKPGGSTGDYVGVSTRAMPKVPMIENPYKGSIPVFLWSKAIEHGTVLKPVEDGLKGVDHLESNIKMIVNLGGNTLINQHSDINDTIRILKDDKKCEFIVTSDLFMTPSARYSDLVLPATSMFEGNNISLPWAAENYFLYNAKVMEPLFACRFEYDWLKEVARIIGVYEEFTRGHETTEDWLADCYAKTQLLEPELPSYEEFKKLGGYQYQNSAVRVTFAEQIRAGKPFQTPSGKIEIFSQTLYDMNQHDLIPGIPCYTPCVEGPSDPRKEKYPLQLIGYHTKRRCHSIHDNNDWMEELDAPALWMHPHDAEKRSITDGGMIEVYNGRGRVRVPAKVTQRIVEGTVALSQGGWYSPDQDGTDLRGSINVLTHTIPTPLAKGNAQHSNLVEVEAYSE